MLDKYNKFLRNYINEGKEEQAKMDELLDKGLENLTKNEKDLLDRLSKGGKLDPEFDFKIGDDAISDMSNDRDFLNNLLGTDIGPETEIYGVRPEKLGNDEPTPIKNDTSFIEGDKVTFKRRGSDHDGKSGMFLGIREDGKYSIKFDDGKRFAALAKNVFPYQDKPAQIWAAPDEKFDDWKSSFNTPNHFRGREEIFQKGDQVQYHNPKSVHHEKIGIFQERRDDGKYIVKFDEIKFTGNSKNFTKFSIQLPKEDFYLQVGKLPAGGGKGLNEDDFPDMLGAGVFLNDGVMYDQEITCEYPELMDMGFEEETEGQLRYMGDFTLNELVEELKERGFRVEFVNGYLY